MNKTGTIILTSVLTVVLCLSLIVGSTFAMFASNTSTNIAVTSGKVEVTASIADFNMFTRDEHGARVDGEWLSGEASEKDGEITLSNMAPYDGVTFDIAVVSSSSVAIKWQVQLVFDGDTQLCNALDVDIDGVELIDTESARASNWTLLPSDGSEQAVATLTVRIELQDSDKIAEGKSCSISVIVFAVQANAQTADPIPYFFPPKQLSNLAK